MVQITPKQYIEVLRAFCETVDDKTRFKGTLQGKDWSFTVAALIYRDGSSPADINDICPIWWEFNTFNGEGVKVENDFSMKYFRSLIKE